MRTFSALETALLLAFIGWVVFAGIQVWNTGIMP